MDSFSLLAAAAVLLAFLISPEEVAALSERYGSVRTCTFAITKHYVAVVMKATQASSSFDKLRAER